MALSIEQKMYCGNNVHKISGDESMEVYAMQDETGEGTMTCFHVLPGIDILFNDFHMQSCISHASPDATMEEVVEAAQKACCHEFITTLPNGYETVIGEGGSTLSRGEKQRISIARAMLKDAPIVITG